MLQSCPESLLVTRHTVRRTAISQDSLRQDKQVGPCLLGEEQQMKNLPTKHVACCSMTDLKLHRTWSTTASWSRTPDAPASLRSRQRPHCSENKHSTWQQEFLGCESENLEQFIRLTVAAWHWIWTLQTTFKGISVWRDRGALVTLWFQCAVYKSIYLLTYLPVWLTFNCKKRKKNTKRRQLVSKQLSWKQ